MKVLVTTYPFNVPIHDCEVFYNTKKSKYTQEEIRERIKEVKPDIIIAGTEKYTSTEFDLCPNLKVISRVGIGTSSIDINEANLREIIIHNTPDSPTNAVVELTITHILYLLKKIHKQEMWKKVIGKEVSECKVGIIGYGRIGEKVDKILNTMGADTIVYDPKTFHIPEDWNYNHSPTLFYIEKIYKECDIITFHTPVLENKIGKKQLEMMKDDVILINTSRGTLFNEEELYDVLSKNPQMSMGIDVYETEPYIDGNLLSLDNVLLTPHIGSFTSKARKEMEKESVNNIKKYLK